jgi:hypothetical protein
MTACEFLKVRKSDRLVRNGVEIDRHAADPGQDWPMRWRKQNEV